jgi:hypothetical protein
VKSPANRGKATAKVETLFHRRKLMRVLLNGIGGAIIILALVTDKLGLGTPGSFGLGQFLLLLMGFILALVGSLGKKFINLYRGIAIIILNTILLLALLELGAIVVSRLELFSSYRENILTSYLKIPYYSSQDWTQIYWQEARGAENYRYKPFVIWRHQPFTGETVNINQEGTRQTPGASCNTEAFKVFIFGGSTVWGWGSPDWGTISAYLQKGLETETEMPVCVENFGEDGYVSTQGLIELIVQLQSGNIPDMVIFYDGVNDVYAAYESGKPGVHPTLSKIEAKFEEREQLLVKWIESTRLFSMIERLAG